MFFIVAFLTVCLTNQGGDSLLLTVQNVTSQVGKALNRWFCSDRQRTHGKTNVSQSDIMKYGMTEIAREEQPQEEFLIEENMLQ